MIVRTIFGLLLACCCAGSVDAQVASIDEITLINSLMRSSWNQADITPTKAASDSEWVRRVYLDLIGRIPKRGELQSFLSNRHHSRRADLVDTLLNDTVYTDEFVDHWSRYWTVVLIGRSEGQRDRLMSRDGMRLYLAEALRENRSYDQIVHELITACGTSKPESPEFNGAVNFLMLKLQDKAISATAKTAQIFLATRIQCTQCHDHPFNSSTAENDWSQAQFWGFNAYFRQAVALRRFASGTRDIDHGELADQDFAGEGTTPEDAEVYFSQRNGILRAAYPTFLDGTALENTSGYLGEVNRRQELAKLTTASPLLSEALVNRMWAYFHGYGFTSPIDDFGPHNPPSHPELLTELARAFRNSDFDLRALMRWIVLSEPYRLSSRGGKPRQDDPTLGQTPQFSRFYLRQMRPEALYNSLAVAGGSELALPDKERWLRQFVIASGNDEGTEASTFDGTIPQTLMMFNGTLVQRAISTQEGGLLTQLVGESSDPKQVVESLYLSTLSRRPTGAETKMARQLLATRARSAANEEWSSGDHLQMNALQDLMWAVLNSGEFILIH